MSTSIKSLLGDGKNVGGEGRGGRGFASLIYNYDGVK